MKNFKFKLMLVCAAALFVVAPAAHADWVDGQDYKWVQYPDLETTGMDVMASYDYKLADDFECTTTGPLTDFHIWSSWYQDMVFDPYMVDFVIAIYDDIPASVGGINYSRPGTLLWSGFYGAYNFMVRIEAGGIEEGWMEPPDYYEFPGDFTCFQYNFFVDPETAFIQRGTAQEPVIYWVAITAMPYDQGFWGWKTSPFFTQWNDNAVYDSGLGWQPMHYPPGHQMAGLPLDLAFVITGDAYDLDWGDAPEDAAGSGYPTTSLNSGASHIIGGPYLGPISDAPDAEPDGQPDATATGDDTDADGDDENGVTIPVPLVEGQGGTINVEVNGGGGILDVWVDWDQSSSWEAAELVFSGPVVNGNIAIGVMPPAGSAGTTFLRARINTTVSLPPDGGPADDGEVEDHEIFIEPSLPPNTKWVQLPDLTSNGIDIKVD
ncbi:MAG: hypothetical protein KAR47_13965, partial [Planctomycetes bacterium]|nr:hypothetical protein [Planctomycetota bacterium]